jgi:hypothetical protein
VAARNLKARLPSDEAIDPRLQPYGAWYTQPGGFAHHTPDEIAAAIDDARKRLTRLRQSPSEEPRINFRLRAALQFGAAGLQAIVLGVMVLTSRLASGVKEHFTPHFVFLSLACLLLLGNSVRLLIFPPTRNPEAMFRTYLSSAIGQWRIWGQRLLLKFDADPQRTWKTPAVMGEAQGTEYVKSFSAYWGHAFGRRRRDFRLTRFKNVRCVLLATDVAVVEAYIVVRSRRLWLLFLAQTPLMLSLLVWVIAILVMVSRRSFPKDRSDFLVLTGLIIGIGLLLTILLTVFALVPKQRKELTIRKILVRVNGQWRVFNGELQGAEEHDTSWLRDG